MAPRPSLFHLLPILRQPFKATPRICNRCLIRLSSTTAPSSPILSKLRDDLKTAMRAKDTARLGVLRALLADITNASKTNSPVKDDLALLAILKKKISQSQGAIEEFKKANRDDLVEKEQAQVGVLEEYAGGVGVLGRDEIREVVKSVIDELKAGGDRIAMGEVMKRVSGPGGKLEGKPVENRTVVSVIKEEMESK